MLNRISTFVSGTAHFSLEKRIFNTASFFLALISVVAFAFSFNERLASIELAGLLLLMLIFCLTFYFSRFKKQFLFSSTFFIISTLLFADVLWFSFPKSSVSISYFYIFLLLLMLTVKSVKSHLGFTLLFIGNPLVIYFFFKQAKGLDWFRTEPWVFSTWLAAMALIAIVVSYFKHNYEQERILKRNSMQKLKNVNLGLDNRNKHMVEFAHMVSHNLRSPMAGMKMLLNLYDLTKSEQEKEDLMDHLKEGAYELFNMVEDLALVMKDYSRLRDKHEPQIMQEAFEKAKNGLSGQILEQNATISSNFEVEVIEYPKVYLESILQNLMSNALKYSHPAHKPKVEVSTYMHQNSVMLTVADNGLGIDVERYGQQLFKMYKTFHPEAGQDSKGVGLFLTKNQVEILGGKIWAESEVGKGTTFFIELYRV